MIWPTDETRENLMAEARAVEARAAEMYREAQAEAGRPEPTLAELAHERDAALAVAIQAGKAFFAMTEAEAIARIGPALRTWMTPEARAEAARIAGEVRKAAGLVEADPEQGP